MIGQDHITYLQFISYKINEQRKKLKKNIKKRLGKVEWLFWIIFLTD